jgi:hypothetical protein
MPQPAPNQVHIDAALTNFGLAYFAEPNNYLGTRPFPVIRVEKQTDKYWFWYKNDWLRMQMEARGPGQESAGSGFTLTNGTYSCDVFALHKDLDHQTAANADLNLERGTARWLAQQSLIKFDRQLVADFLTTGLWNGGTDLTGVASSPSSNQFVQWNNKTASDPRADIELGKLTILTATSMMPNTLIIGYQVFQALKQHPDFRSQLQYTSPDSITAQMLGAILEIPRVFVNMGVYATNNEGETGAYALTQGKTAWLGYVDPNPTTETPTAAATFEWGGVSQGLGEGIGISQFYIPQLKVQRYEIESAWDNKIIASDLGIFYTSAVA